MRRIPYHGAIFEKLDVHKDHHQNAEISESLAQSVHWSLNDANNKHSKGLPLLYNE